VNGVSGTALFNFDGKKKIGIIRRRYKQQLDERVREK
jgi:hypothetical protein